jgi:hypothetical protein
VLAAWEAGALFPRLVDVAGRQEPARCRFCRVAEACLRGDSGARSRLAAYAAHVSGTGNGAAGSVTAAFAGAWLLAQGEGPGALEDGAGEAAAEDA